MIFSVGLEMKIIHCASLPDKFTRAANAICIILAGQLSIPSWCQYQAYYANTCATWDSAF